GVVNIARSAEAASPGVVVDGAFLEGGVGGPHLPDLAPALVVAEGVPGVVGIHHPVRVPPARAGHIPVLLVRRESCERGRDKLICSPCPRSEPVGGRPFEPPPASNQSRLSDFG